MSQWRCKECGAIRARPHTHIIRGDEYLVASLGRPCKRCGSHECPEAEWDPWLDIAEDSGKPSLGGKVG